MKKLIFYITMIIFLCNFSLNNSFADDNIEKIYKIESYSYDDILKRYILEQYGSSIYVKDGLIYTNAHVILNEEKKPFGNYRVCKTIDFKETAKCFSTGKLLYFDTINDLAVLKVEGNEGTGVTYSKRELNIGDIVKVYGYPSNGGDTITYTEGKISGYEKGLYKIDANLDAGNSGGGIFDSDGNLIGMAVSVSVGYTTLGYVIPLETIQEFINKKGENIEKYNTPIKSSFEGFNLQKNKVIGSNNFKNDNISLNNFINQGFNISEYRFDDSNNNFYIELSDKNNDSTISIENIIIDGKNDYDINLDLESYKKETEKLKKETYVKKFTYKKIKVKDKDAILSIYINKDNDIYLTLEIIVSKNNKIIVNINSSNIKNKTFLKGVKLILKNLDIKNKDEITKDDYYMLLDNLKLAKLEGFYVFKSTNGNDLVNYGDISISSNRYIKYKKEDFGNDYTLSDSIKKSYSTLKDYYYIYDYLIKETKSGENYIYAYGLNNKSKKGYEDKEEDKYFINAFYYDKIDEENLYMYTIIFTFNEEISKKQIDDLLNSIKTSSGEGVFPIGDMKIGENIVE